MLVHVKNNNIYITVYMHRYMCLHMCIHVYLSTYMHMYMYACCVHIHTCTVYIHIYMYIHAYIHIYAHVQYICMYINCIIAGVHDGKTKREGVWNTHMLIRKFCCISMVVAILYIDTTCNGNFINNFGCYYI